MSLKVAIIEDEPAIARNLEYTLGEIGKDIAVLYVLGSVSESVDWLKANIQRCDLLFMDIRLSDGLSFEIFEHIEPVVPVIFITAYDDYALQAFKANGVDYILKPFEQKDIARALDKLQRIRHNSTGEDPRFAERVQTLLNYMENAGIQPYKEAYLVHYQNKLVPLPVEHIHWFYTSNEVVYAHTSDGKKYVIDTTLERIQQEVSPVKFFRANRQFILQKKAIRDIDFYFNGRLVVNVLPKPDEKIIVSKARAPEFKKWLDD
ncbi:LytR/AlgR family response regulator transcription factor [Sinomicrobium sp. M5D2P17]